MEDNAPPPLNAPAPPPPPVPPMAPPPAPPPVIIAPPTSPAPRRGRGWMVFAIILFVLLAISMLYNLSNFAGNVLHGRSGRLAGRNAGPRLEETELPAGDADAASKIAVIEVDGIITSRAMDSGGYNMVDLVRAQLKRAEEDDKVKAVILKVDSPGGEVLASDEINRAITEFQKKPSAKPVVASMGSLAASGGYYVSVPCRWIVANELTLTGSIGVILSSWNYRGLMDKVGVLPQTFKSGKFKDMLSGSREPSEITQEERDMVQGLIMETYDRFKEVVQKGRNGAYEKNKSSSDKGRQLADDWQQFADGRVLSGMEAYKRGFVDELGDFEAAIKRAKKLAGISDANLIQYQLRYDLSDLLHLFGKSDAKSIKVDLGMDAPKLQAGQLYFLSPTFLH
jgi:protease-4